MRFCPLASGSKGNVLFLETKQKRLLIDVGLSAKQVEERLKKINVDPKTIDAVMITHEHADHVRGLEVFASKFDLPVFANIDTAKALHEMGARQLAYTIFTTGESFHFGGCDITPFSIQHDTMDPVAFTIEEDATKLGVCADLGFVTSLVRVHLQNCNGLYLESNHEPNMVHASSRPQVYKTRVLGRQGHLSNDACCTLLSEIATPELKHVFLAHLSEECNSDELAFKKAREVLSDSISLEIAHQHHVSYDLTL